MTFGTGDAMKLYDNPFSPFARKVRMVLEHKGLVFDAIDGLDKDNYAALARVNPRRECRRYRTTVLR